MKTKINLYNLSVKIDTEDMDLAKAIVEFVNQNYVIVSMGFGRNAEQEVKVFAGQIYGLPEFILSNEQFRHFLHDLKSRGKELKDYGVIDHREYHAEDTNIEVVEHFKTREKQVPALNWIVDHPTGIRMLPLNMGSGKTYISLRACEMIGKRFVILILPNFIGKWIGDLKEIYGATEDEIVVIQETDPIKIIIERSKRKDLPYKYYIVALTSMRRFLDDYENNPDACKRFFGCNPFEFFPLMGVNTILADEAHLHYHMLFRVMLYANVKLHIGLTATLISNDPKEMLAYNALYPVSSIFPDTMVTKYINFFYITYECSWDTLKKLRYSTNFRKKDGPYSQTALEKSIIKNKNILKSYLDIIDSSFNYLYERDYKPGNKGAIYVGLVEMANLIYDYMSAKYPDKKVRRFYDKFKDMNDLEEGEIIITTIQSAGVGFDIKSLTAALITVSRGSPRDNLQVAGRLRMLNDAEVLCGFLSCEKIKKHNLHKRERKELFKTRAKSSIDVRTRHQLEG